MNLDEAVSFAAKALPLASVLCSALSAAIPDARLGVLAKVVNALALNIGNAKNAQPVDEQDSVTPKP